MFNRHVLIIGALAHAAIGALFAQATPAAGKGVVRTPGNTKTARQIVSATGGFPRRPPRTVAQDKRDARKARNRQRNKRAHRGART